jgi:hypothetical protein
LNVLFIEISTPTLGPGFAHPATQTIYHEERS